MALFDWFSRKTPLQLALQRGRQGGNFSEEIRELGDLTIRSRQDAEAICEVLEEVLLGRAPKGDGLRSPLPDLAGLFQEVDGAECDAFVVLHERGCALLRQTVEKALACGTEDEQGDVLFLLKILAMYGARESSALIVRTARSGFKPEDWLWSVVLGVFKPQHPEAPHIFAALSEPLPVGFIAVSLLDGANSYLLEDGAMRHPFDSEAGVARLREWLASRHDEHFSYAVSAVAALPFIEHAARPSLLEKAMVHPSPEVRLEAAWAAGKLGLASGFDTLAEMCLDVNQSAKARSYLRELGREDCLPTGATSPDFQAKAEFAQWLAHPNELGRPPDEIEIFDHRKLHWPPDFAERLFWLIRYRVKNTSGLEADDVGVGLVGSTTFCLFSYDMDQRPPEDGYALHCCWEMENAKAIELADVEGSSREYDGLLAPWPGPPLENARILHVMELNAELRHPRKLVAVAEARQTGAAGWAVLDGPDSHWYPAAELLPEENGKTVLKLHVGRQLLHLPLEAERTSWARPAEPIPPEQIVHRYEQLLTRAPTLAESEQAKLLSGFGSPLTKHFTAYIDALLTVCGGVRAASVIATYQRFLELAEKTTALTKEKAFDTFTPMGEHLAAYVDAMVELGRAAELRPLIEKLLPLWSHNSGYATLGAAAFATGDFALAEKLLTQLRAGMKTPLGCDEAEMLAQIWQRRGEAAAARELLIAGLRHTLTESGEATGTDVQFYENRFQKQRQAFLRVFPGEADAFAQLGIPATTLLP